jgi:hypothetical protein
MGIEPPEMAVQAQARAQERDWSFETVPGDMTLIEKLVNGDWPEADFLRVEPGQGIKQDYTEGVVRAVDAAS